MKVVLSVAWINRLKIYIYIYKKTQIILNIEYDEEEYLHYFNPHR